MFGMQDMFLSLFMFKFNSINDVFRIRFLIRDMELWDRFKE